MKVEVILPTAGLGERLKSDTPKPLVKLNGKPLFIYSLEVFEHSPAVSGVVIVAHEELIDVFKGVVQEYNLKKVKNIVSGGQTRQASVNNGLKCLDDDTEVVIVHDGARPFIDKGLVDDIVAQMAHEQAVITAVKLKPTIKKIDNNTGYVLQTLDRDELVEVQTPQAFKKDVLIKAHAESDGTKATDDAALVESAGVKVKICQGSYKNIKITTAEDINIAKGFLSCTNV